MKKRLILLFLILNLVLVFAFWWMGSGTLMVSGFSSALLALGRLAGLLAAVLVLMQFVTISRTVWLEETFGLDKLTRIHHLSGEYGISLIILHPILLIFSYKEVTKLSLWGQLIDFTFNYPDVWQAVIAVILFMVIVALSIYIVRKHLKYETWYFVHLLTYLALILSFKHQFSNGGDLLVNKVFYFYWLAIYVLVFLNQMYFRFLKPLYISWQQQFRVEKVVSETADTHSIYIKCRDLKNFRIKPGQFMKFYFLQKRFWWQAHPFSLSNYPDGNYLRITPKAVGDYTSLVSELKRGTRVIIDGPYGIFTNKIRTKKKVLFIAAGVGITPIRSLMEEMAGKMVNIKLIYSVSNQNEIIFKKEIDRLAKKYNFPVEYVITEKVGRLDETKLQKSVFDIKEREVYLCGPVPFMDAIGAALLRLGVAGKYIHYEKFSL